MKPLRLLCPAQGPSLRGPPRSFSVGPIRPSATSSRADRCTPRRNVVCVCTCVHLHRCACLHVCTGACLHTRVHVYVSVRIYVLRWHMCDTGTYCAHSVAVTSTYPDGVHSRAAPPSHLLAGVAPAGPGAGAGVAELGLLHSALWVKAAPSPCIIVLTPIRLQGSSSRVGLVYEQFLGARVTRYVDNCVGRN